MVRTHASWLWVESVSAQAAETGDGCKYPCSLDCVSRILLCGQLSESWPHRCWSCGSEIGLPQHPCSPVSQWEIEIEKRKSVKINANRASTKIQKLNEIICSYTSSPCLKVIQCGAENKILGRFQLFLGADYQPAFHYCRRGAPSGHQAAICSTLQRLLSQHFCIRHENNLFFNSARGTKLEMLDEQICDEK